MNNALQLSTKTLAWAAAKSGANNLYDFASSLYSNKETVNNIINGRLKVSEIRKFAQTAKIPFGFMFLPSPPGEYLLEESFLDFRTTKNRIPLSKNFLDIYKDIQHKQLWYHDYLMSIGAKEIDFVGKFSDEKDTDPLIIANSIRDTLNLNTLSFPNINDPSEYYNSMSKQCEISGILIFKNSIVVNNTKRKLDPEEFRGFVISDLYAPAIFVNGADTKYANIFTLAHELAHIWLGESGISDTNINSTNATEIRCNKIAAELLVPKDKFITSWEFSTGSEREKISNLNKIFFVSELVIAKVALENGKISKSSYNSLYSEIMEFYYKKKEEKNVNKAIVPYTITLPIRNSRLLTKTVLNLVKNNRMNPSEASILLNTKASRIFSL